jgi:subtilisin family serine protease
MGRAGRRGGLWAGVLAAVGLVVGSAAPAWGQASGQGQANGNQPASPPRERGNSAAAVAAEHGRPIQGRYIVSFEKGTGGDDVRSARDEARAQGAEIHFEYTRAFNGFAATLPEQALQGLQRNPRIDFIEPDSIVTASETQLGATWGLDRIDQRALPLATSYTYNATGAGVKAYIVDTGIRSTHVDFGGRVAPTGYTAIADGQGTQDCNGHGTHVAGTVGGTSVGVAKQVQLVAVRVLGCDGSGTTSGIIAGIDWITADHAAGQPAVANLSLGGSASTALDTAVKNSIVDGVTYAIAAGNDNANACYYSPARVGTAITVGATTVQDGRSSFSNYGTCLDIFAPGTSISSAWYTADNAGATISGTSMATPHVAGVAALYLQSNRAATPAAVRDAIVNSATPSAVLDAGLGSPNRLLYSLFGPPPAPPAPPSCALPESYPGSLAGPADYDYHPRGTYFYAAAGTHRGCLRNGPAGTDFDLYLMKWTGSYWAVVAQGITTTSNEDITYSGAAGYYMWRVESYSGSGSYTVSFKRP